MAYEIVISRRRSALPPFGSVACAAFGYWLIWISFAVATASIITAIVGAACLCIGVATGIAALIPLFRSGPVLTVDDHGVFDARRMTKPIPWHDIIDINTAIQSATPFFTPTYAILTVRTPKQYANVIGLWNLGKDRSSDLGEFSISFRELDTTLEKFLTVAADTQNEIAVNALRKLESDRKDQASRQPKHQKSLPKLRSGDLVFVAVIGFPLTLLLMFWITSQAGIVSVQDTGPTGMLLFAISIGGPLLMGYGALSLWRRFRP